VEASTWSPSATASVAEPSIGMRADDHQSHFGLDERATSAADEAEGVDPAPEPSAG